MGGLEGQWRGERWWDLLQLVGTERLAILTGRGRAKHLTVYHDLKPGDRVRGLGI